MTLETEDATRDAADGARIEELNVRPSSDPRVTRDSSSGACSLLVSVL